MNKNSEETKNLQIRDASDVYDRQIRLWGADAQSKISSANVLYINVTGVSSEIMKNLVLAGVQASICDGRSYPDALVNTPCSFLPPQDRIKTSPQTQKRKISVAQVMQQHVHELNPLLKLPLIEERPLEKIPDSFFSTFEIVIASRIPLDQAKRIAEISVSSGNKFFQVDCFGLYGCAILDLGPNHLYRREIGKDKLSEAISTKPYLPFIEILQTELGTINDRWNKICPREFAKYKAILQFHAVTGNWPGIGNADEFPKIIQDWLVNREKLPNSYMEDEELKSLALTALSEISPICAVLGGVLGNEVVKALSGKGEPANNVLLFDGTDGGCRTFVVQKNVKGK